MDDATLAHTVSLTPTREHLLDVRWTADTHNQPGLAMPASSASSASSASTPVAGPVAVREVSRWACTRR